MLPEKLEVRPRTAGEVLDEAGRLYLACGPQLLALSGLFQVPAAVALLLLLTQPAVFGMPWLLPALTATLVSLTGLGAGACHEAFRRLANGMAVELGPCLAATLRHGLRYAAGRAFVLTVAAPLIYGFGAAVLAAARAEAILVGFSFALLAVLALGCVALILWISIDLHPLLASDEWSPSSIGRVITHTIQLQPGKAAAVVFCRFALLLFTVLNFHLLVEMGLWIAGNLAGLDIALAGAMVSLSNPVYATALVLFGWLLLTPYGEAAGFLLYADMRARHEGLDLWFRVQRHFPLGERSRAGVAVLAVAAALLAAAPARAADERLDAVRQTRQEVQRITGEVRAADPYPGGGRWTPRLNALARRLGPSYRWFDRAIVDFAARNRDGGLEVLADLDRRLALVEESLTPADAGGEPGRSRPSREEIKKLLPESTDGAGPAAEPPRKQTEKDRQPVERDDAGEGPAKRRGPGVVGPRSGGGLDVAGWTVLGGLLLAVLLVVAVRLWRGRKPARKGPQRTGTGIPAPEPAVSPAEQSAADLWARAEELARTGRFLEAVRWLYLGVLSLLHRAGLVRYERTRTNGEYVQQLVLSPSAPAELHVPFRRLVRLFEEKYYGERSCEAPDYHACRELAQDIRSEVQG